MDSEVAEVTVENVELGRKVNTKLAGILKSHFYVTQVNITLNTAIVCILQNENRVSLKLNHPVDDQIGNSALFLFINDNFNSIIVPVGLFYIF